MNLLTWSCGLIVVQEYPILRLRKSKSKLECELVDPAVMQIIRIDEKMTKKSEEAIKQHYKEILKMASSKNECIEKQSFKKELNKLGKEIGNILKNVLGRLSINIKEEPNLALALDDETVKIPWELGRIREGNKYRFFCDVAGIGRLRVAKAEFWEQPPKRSKTRRALVVGINYEDCERDIEPLEFAEKEAERIKTILEDNDIQVQLLLGKKARREALTKELKRGVDIFHFAGHGGRSRNKAEIYLFNKKENIRAKDLESLLGNSAAPSLSFFNTCETSVDTPEEGEGVSWAPYSWAFALTEQGGEVFIGTLWSIPEKEALCFAETFYKKFLGVGYNTLAEAMRQARNRTKKIEKDAIPNRLAYILYGPPTLKAEDLFGT